MQKQAIKIIKKLRANGHSAYFAGGAVRDILLGREPQDIDIVTSAIPDEVENLFDSTVSVGRKFGVIAVRMGKKQFEVATFRSDHGYSDARRPDKVKWASAKQDAQRRDFTINAIFYDPVTKKVLDFVNGLKDLDKKLVRFIGDPSERIQEDNLRLLRAVRLKNNLNFEYDLSTWQAVKDSAHLIESVSSERVRDELNKMFAYANRSLALLDLDKSGLLKIVLPEIEKLKEVDQSWKFHAEGTVFTHTLLSVKALPGKSSLELFWGTLLHDIGKPATQQMVPDKRHGGQRVGFYGHHEVGAKMAQKLLKRLHFPNHEIELIVWLVRRHMMVHEILEMRQGRKIRWLRDERLPLLLELHRADASGKQKRINLDAYHKVKKLMDEELAKPPPPPKLVDGNDIMREFSLEPGIEVGRLLKIVEEAVWDGKVKSKQEALHYLKKQIK